MPSEDEISNKPRLEKKETPANLDCGQQLRLESHFT